MKKTLFTITAVILSNFIFAQTQNDLDMIQAAYDGDEDRVEYFLTNGANVNAEDAEGYTAIIYASAYGYHGIMKKLIAKGAKVNEFKNDSNPIFAAVNGNDSKSLDILLKAKGNINCKDAQGYTPLMLAAQENYFRMIDHMLRNGAKLDTENHDGHTALSIAIQRGQNDAVSSLIRANPKKSGYSNYATSPINTADYMSNKKAEKSLKKYGMRKSFKPGLDFVSVGLNFKFSSYEALSGYEIGLHEKATKIDLFMGYMSIPKNQEFDFLTDDYYLNMEMLIYASLNKRFTVYRPKKAGYGFSIGGDFFFAEGRDSKTTTTEQDLFYGANISLFRFGSFLMFRLNYNYYIDPNTRFFQHSVFFGLGINLYKPKTSKFIHADKTLYML